MEPGKAVSTSNTHQTSQATHRTLGKSCIELQHHQSGVNCLDTIHLHSDLYLVASGGDDNSLSVSILRLSHEDGIVDATCLHTCEVPSAHAAQVSGKSQEYSNIHVSCLGVYKCEKIYKHFVSCCFQAIFINFNCVVFFRHFYIALHIIKMLLLWKYEL